MAKIFEYGLIDAVEKIIGYGLVPVALMCWIYSFANLVYPNKQKILILSFLGISIIHEIIVIMVIYNPDSLFMLQIFMIILSLIFLITGYIFTNNSLKAEDKKIRLKGIFLSIAFTSFIAGTIIDSIFYEEVFALLIFVRLLYISSAFEYYLGFFLPQRLANLLVKE